MKKWGIGLGLILSLATGNAFGMATFQTAASLEWKNTAITVDKGMSWGWGEASFDDGNWLTEVYGALPYNASAFGDWFYDPEGLPFSTLEGYSAQIGQDGTWPVGYANAMMAFNSSGIEVGTEGADRHGDLYAHSFIGYSLPLIIKGSAFMTVTLDYLLDYTLKATSNSSASANGFVELALGESLARAGFDQNVSEDVICESKQGQLSITRWMEEGPSNFEIAVGVDTEAHAAPEPTSLALLGFGIITFGLNCWFRKAKKGKAKA